MVKPISYSPNGIVLPAVHLEMCDNDIVVRPNTTSEMRHLNAIGVEGVHFLVKDGQLLGKGSRLDQEYLVANAVLERVIAKVTLVDIYGKEHIRYRCLVSSCRWQETKVFEVEDISTIFKKVHDLHPEVVLYQKGADAQAELIADVFAASQGTMEVLYEFEKTGWVDLGEGSVRYQIGTHSSYRKWIFPDVASCSISEKRGIFLAGCDFLRVGNCGKEIFAIFLYGHMGYSAFWFRKAYMDIRFLLYVVGWHASLKTSTSVECVMPFVPDVEDRFIQLTDSSWPGIRQKLLLAQDSVLLLDDFSQTERRIGSESRVNFEKIIRAIGNGKLSEKRASGKDASQPTEIRTMVIVTGEEPPDLGFSSFARMQVVNVDRSTFDGRILAHFQENRGILRDYFALYISFLEKNPERVVGLIQEASRSYRQKIEEMTEEPRVRQNALCFAAQACLTAEFGIWCGLDRQDMMNFVDESLERLASLIQKTDQARMQIRADVLFVRAVWAQVTCGSKYCLAETGKDYHENRRSFCIGFLDVEGDFLWLKMEDAMAAAQDYCAKHDLFLTRNSAVIKKALWKHGLLDKPNTGWVHRWTRGDSRERFIRLYYKKILKIVKEDDDGGF